MALRVDKRKLREWEASLDMNRHLALQHAYKYFEVTTALGCAQRKKPFDADKCKRAWELYNDVLEQNGTPRFPALELT